MDIIQTSGKKITAERSSYVRHKSMKYLQLHDYYEGYFLLEGERKYFIDSKLYSLQAGDFVLVPPDVLHRSVGDNAGFYSRVLLTIPKKFMEKELVTEFYEGGTEYVLKIPAKRRKYLESILEKMEYETGRNDSHSEYLLKSYANELFIFLIRIKARTDFSRADKEADRVIGEAASFIRENFDKPLTLEITARRVRMSKTYFCKMFREKTGFGFSDYLAGVRITEAAKMLTDTDMNITEIATKCGFNDSSYFATVFKRIKGVTPVKYRKSREI